VGRGTGRGLPDVKLDDADGLGQGRKRAFV
jgi:hypothetical protein